jgi:tRNA (cmo5U34)-methyltransferase
MKSLKKWLRDTANTDLEDMSGFFSKRIDGYEEHMAVWNSAYSRFAELLPHECKNILDLGCGTGLELDEIWKRNPNIIVNGVDLCQSMLDKLLEKQKDKPLKVICEDYFQYDMGVNRWDAVISFESMHHFFPEQKSKLYKKIYHSLKMGKQFILGDYIACCDEEEKLLCDTYLEKRKKSSVPEDSFVHFDIPLTLEHEIGILREAGFSEIEVADCIEGATIIISKK